MAEKSNSTIQIHETMLQRRRYAFGDFFVVKKSPLVVLFDVTNVMSVVGIFSCRCVDNNIVIDISGCILSGSARGGV